MSDERGKSYEGAAPAGAGAGRQQPAPTERRVALVIGNGAYRKPGSGLPNPPRDAEGMAAALTRLGFECLSAEPGRTWNQDVDLNTFGSLLARFAVATHSADMAVLYFAGHGIEVNGTNYLIPVSAELEHVGALHWETRSLPDILAALQGARKLRLLILDACRNNPFRETIRGLEGVRSFGAALSQPEPPGNTLVFYAARHGTTAKDGAPGGNSPFATALLRHIETPNLELLHMFGEVADDVRELTGHAQEPYLYGTKGRALIYLRQTVTEPASSPVSPPSAGGTHTLHLAAQEWAQLQSSPDLNRLRRFAQHFPGYYGDLALDRVAELEREAAERVRVEQERRNAEELARRHDADWQTAEREGTAAAYERFMAAWTSGPHIETARQRIAAVQDKERQAAEQGERSFEVVVGDGTNDRTVRLAPGETAPKDVAYAPEMVLVPPGTYLQGDETKPMDGNYRREVTIDYPLLVGKYSVTFDEWDAYVQKSEGSAGFLGLGRTKPRKPGDQYWGRGRRPVIDVSWHDAQGYAKWLSETTGKTYRLLSEAEWEYACRAGTETIYSFGDERKIGDYAWYSANSGSKTQPVGGKKPNGFGLHDMHGNVWEWCEDAGAVSYQGAPVDGAARASADTSVSRVLRGGSWLDQPENLRSASRSRSQPDSRGGGNGFRLARTLNPNS